VQINKGEMECAKAKVLSRVLALLMSIIVPTLSRYEVLPKAAVLQHLDSICHWSSLQVFVKFSLRILCQGQISLVSS